MRVLMTADTMGGVWTYALDLARELGQRGVAVHLFTMGRLPDDAQRATVARTPGLELTATDYRLEWMQDPWDDVARAGRHLLDLARKYEPDVVHLNGFAHGSLDWDDDTATLVVGHSCVETWWRAVHGVSAPPEWEAYRQQVTRGIHAADAFVAPTRVILSAFSDVYGPHPRSRVIPNGTGAATALPPGNTAAKEPVVLTAGRVWDPAKNVAVLCAAMAGAAWPLLIAGDGEATGSHARALGWLEPAELNSWMERAAVYAAPAKYEPFGLSALEAARAGCALVLGDIPTLREVWGDAALYADPADAVEVRRQIDRLIEDATLRSDLAHRARTRAATYTAKRMAEGYLGLYREMVAWRRCRGREEVAACAS